VSARVEASSSRGGREGAAVGSAGDGGYEGREKGAGALVLHSLAQFLANRSVVILGRAIFASNKLKEVLASLAATTEEADSRVGVVIGRGSSFAEGITSSRRTAASGRRVPRAEGQGVRGGVGAGSAEVNAT